MSSDPSLIEQYALRLQRKAGSRVNRLTSLGVVLGGLLGSTPLLAEHISAMHSAIPHRYAYAVVLMGAAAGAYLGYLLGQSRAVALRLQASLALNQLEIERVVRRVEGIRLTLPAAPAPLPAAAPMPALPAPVATPAPVSLPAPAVSFPPPTPILPATPAPAPVFAPAAEAPTISALPAMPPMSAPVPVSEPVQLVAQVAPEPAPVPTPAPATVQPVPTVQIVPPPTFEWNAPPTSASGS